MNFNKLIFFRQRWKFYHAIRLVIVTFALIYQTNLVAQSLIDTNALKFQLSIIHERDQKTRSNGEAISIMRYIDSLNLIQIDSIINKYGWPGISFIGTNGNGTVWLVIQHADLATQEKYLPLLKESVNKNESKPSHLALLQDRILMRKNLKQIYGTQIWINQTTGEQEIWPIEDEKNINKRRFSVGLEPMEEYAKLFGIEYSVPK